MICDQWNTKTQGLVPPKTSQSCQVSSGARRVLYALLERLPAGVSSVRRPVCVVGLGLWGSGASSIICFCSNGCSSPGPIGKRVPACFVQLEEEEAEVQLLPEDESVLLNLAVQQFSALYSFIIMGYLTSRLGQVCVFLVESKPPSSLCSFSDRFLFSSFFWSSSAPLIFFFLSLYLLSSSSLSVG